jgi:hypothetical protein
VRYMARYISSLFLTAAIAAPTAIMAHPRRQAASRCESMIGTTVITTTGTTTRAAPTGVT